MAMGKRRKTAEQALFVAVSEIKVAENPFYRALNGLLDENGFDEFAEDLCREFYAGNVGRPGIPPGVYFRMMMVGFLEGISSERGIAWRCGDSVSLRDFLGYGLAKNPPDHSSLSRTRKRLTVETHAAVFARVLKLLDDSGLLSGGTLGVDSTTLEANAAMRSIVRRDGGTGYEEWLRELARASGIETPTREELAKLDRKRPKKGSNAEWVHPGYPEARIAKMKDGRTHLAHKLEQAVDLDSGAVVGVTVQTTDGGDVASLTETLDEAAEQLAELGGEAAEVVCDKGHHSNKTMKELAGRGLRSYVSEPARGRRSWKKDKEARQRVYANRRRIQGERGKWLLRLRGEKLERTFAHLLVTGGMRRVHVRGQDEIRKRMLIHVAAFNLGGSSLNLVGSWLERLLSIACRGRRDEGARRVTAGGAGREVEAAEVEEDGDDEAVVVAVAAGAGLDHLDPAVDALGRPVGRSQHDGVEDAPQVGADHLGDLADGRERAARRPLQPVQPGVLGRAPELVVPQLRGRFLHRPGAGRPVHALAQRRERQLLGMSHLAATGQPPVARPREHGAALRRQLAVLGAPHLVHRVRQVLGHVEAVERRLQLRARHPLPRRRHVGTPHVHRHALQPGQPTLVPAPVELRQRLSGPALRDMQHAPRVRVRHDRRVPVSALDRRLVHRQPPDRLRLPALEPPAHRPLHDAAHGVPAHPHALRHPQLASPSHAATSSSNAAVYRDLSAAQGIDAVFTPCSGHSTRGRSQTTNVLQPQASRCRHARSRAS